MSPHERRVTIVNPLGGALEHYAAVLASALGRGGGGVAVEALLEPSRGGGGRVAWLLGYLRVLLSLRRGVRRDGRVVLVAWPVVGYLDVVILRALFGRRARAHVVVHDPVPLVGAVGYSRLSRALARVLSTPGMVVAQSSAGSEALVGLGLGCATSTLPLPVDRPRRPEPSAAVVRVLGQFKRDRDLDLLRGLAVRLGGRYRLEIHGRGWGDVEGWEVQEGFVSEEAFDRLVASSAVVLIPYRRFYQSDVAVRCLERATPFVGPVESSLADYYGVSSRLLVATEGCGLDERVTAWARAIDEASAMEAGALEALALGVHEKTALAWQDWLHAA